MIIEKLYIGGWFQRTTLHLTEIWDFLSRAHSRLAFPEDELQTRHDALALSSVKRQSGPLEYLEAETSLGINYRVYEDGLIILEKKFGTMKEDFALIKHYYDDKLSKGLGYIFSKGAPVPKELANIETILPYILTVREGSREEIEALFKEASETIYSVLTTESVEVYRASGLIVINNLDDEKLAREVIESQIFFREFKSQLYRYLAIHRAIWGKIQAIKERGEIRGTEVDKLRNELADYQKTVNLIGGRIDQMPAYVQTRQKLTDIEKIDTYLQPLFQFKFETLLDTHQYIQHLWSMTKNYLSSAIDMFTELQAKSTKNTISSLQLITTIGVVSGIFGYLSNDELPKFTSLGLIYFVLLLALTWILNSAVSYIYKNLKYKVQDKDFEKNIS